MTEFSMRIGRPLGSLAAQFKEMTLTAKTATRQFRRYRYISEFGVPAPVRGGTWFYCGWTADQFSPGEKPDSLCERRFRRDTDYRRHYRRFHQPEPPVRGASPGMVVYDELEGSRMPSWEETRKELEAAEVIDAVNERLRRARG